MTKKKYAKYFSSALLLKNNRENVQCCLHRLSKESKAIRNIFYSFGYL